ncbi:Protein PAIR1-like protein [Melia azedarach]|uniref:Protein PAIR1-like protein n=2 Tax=Melia azedarach TaxID=155640 RepID=A0ACC1YZ06_MELAZ|nr:Protein PAIR1-like protein [Melia azedarach]KAJ4728274.1 Protein PAIR1-like protein [Melia azedarach]
MKLKINKACDLSSISVFPPHARRTSALASGPQASQLRTQQSQQSFSQGISSQHGIVSQLSQSSLDEIVTNDQRAYSQEPETSAKKYSCLPPASYTREESQMPMSRSSTNLVRKWNPVSASDQRCQISGELERRIGMMETSLNRFGMILDSVQNDVVQVNRGSKEVLLEVQGICQKLIVQDTLLQLMNKGQEDVKASLDGGLKYLFDQLGKNLYEDKFKEIFLELSSLPGKIEASLLKLHTELCSFLTKEMKTMTCSMKSPNQEDRVATVTSQKRTRCHVTSERKPKPQNNPAVPPEVSVQGIQVAKVEMGGWKSVRKEPTLEQSVASKEIKLKGVSSVRQAKECRIIIDSDEEIDGGLSCLIDKKEIGNNENKMMEDVKVETERILRKARRQKRKHNIPIIIN